MLSRELKLLREQIDQLNEHIRLGQYEFAVADVASALGTVAEALDSIVDQVTEIE
jgi:hypothetical protein